MFIIAVLGENPEFNNTVKNTILSNGNGSAKTLNDFSVEENNSFRIISAHNLFDEECPHLEQQVAQFKEQSSSGVHLFILAIDSENAQMDNVVSQIGKLQNVFGQNVTEHLVVVFENYMSYMSLSHLKQRLNIKMATLCEHLVHDCMKWCSKRQLFLHNCSKEVVKRRETDFEMARNEHFPPCNHERTGPSSLQSISHTPAETAPEQYHGEPKFDISQTEFSIVLLGLTGTGKSASGNTILKAVNPQLQQWQLFESKPSSTPVTTKCQFKMINLFGRHVRVVDTPDYLNDRNNYQAQVEACMEYCQPGQCVVLLVIQMGRFTEGEKGILERLEEKLGWKIRERTIVLLTHGENVKGQVQSFIAERSYLSYIVEACDNRYHVFKNTSKNPKQVMELFKKIPQYKELFPESTKKQSHSDCCMC